MHELEIPFSTDQYYKESEGFEHLLICAMGKTW